LQFREAAAKGKAIVPVSTEQQQTNEGLADLSRDLSATWADVRVAAAQHAGVPIPPPLALDVPDHLGTSTSGNNTQGLSVSCVGGAVATSAATEARRRHSLYAVCSSPLPYLDVMRPMQYGQFLPSSSNLIIFNDDLFTDSYEMFVEVKPAKDLLGGCGGGKISPSPAPAVPLLPPPATVRPKTAASAAAAVTAAAIAAAAAAAASAASSTTRFTVAYHFEKLVRSAGDRCHHNRMERLVAELESMKKSLPLTDSSSIFVRHDTDRLDIMKVLITGPSGTPYSNGCFEFDVYFPPDYPQTAVKVFK